MNFDHTWLYQGLSGAAGMNACMFVPHHVTGIAFQCCISFSEWNGIREYGLKEEALYR